MDPKLEEAARRVLALRQKLKEVNETLLEAQKAESSCDGEYREAWYKLRDLSGLGLVVYEDEVFIYDYDRKYGRIVPVATTPQPREGA